VTYWIRDFENSKTGQRYRVYSEAQYVPALLRKVADKQRDQDWLDDQVYRHDAGLDIKRDGDHPLRGELLRPGEMPLKTAEDLQRECLRMLKMNMTTREIERVGIIRTHPSGDGPNWTYSELYPEPTPIGRSDADVIIMSVAGRWALADGE
jgi:hypothetical protein